MCYVRRLRCVNLRFGLKTETINKSESGLNRNFRFLNRKFFSQKLFELST